MTLLLTQRVADFMERYAKQLRLEAMTLVQLEKLANETQDDWVWFRVQKEFYRRGLLPDRIRSRDDKKWIRFAPRKKAA